LPGATIPAGGEIVAANDDSSDRSADVWPAIAQPGHRAAARVGHQIEPVRPWRILAKLALAAVTTLVGVLIIDNAV
jgi:hypothetical protein